MNGSGAASLGNRVDDLKVVIATHREYPLPTSDAYLPVQVGSANTTRRLPYVGDDEGVHISHLNSTYCELTALYWAWKNTHHEAYGLCHYRRYFAGSTNRPADASELREMLMPVDVVVAKRRHYVIQTVRAQYAHSHHERDLDTTRAVLMERSPDYASGFDRLMSMRSLSLYNMFLMRRDLLDQYCEWLFSTLDEVRVRIPLESYGPAQQRAAGYLGERLLNVWLLSKPELNVRRQRLYEPERIPYLIAGTRMVGRMAGFGKAG